MPSETVRRELLNALREAQAKCAIDTARDQGPQQTRAMIEANASFVSSMSLCRSVPPSNAEKVGPAPWPTTTSPETSPAPAGPCLKVSRPAPQRYVVSNRACGASSMLAVIEIRAPSGEIACKAHTVTQQFTVTVAEDRVVQLNYQCRMGEGNCSREQVVKMFPECDW